MKVNKKSTRDPLRQLRNTVTTKPLRIKEHDRAQTMVNISSKQATELRRLARINRTSFKQELSDAIDAYVLGVSPQEVRILDGIADQLNASLDRADLTLDRELAQLSSQRKRRK